MKYLVFIVVILSCKSSPKKVFIPSYQRDSSIVQKKDSVTMDFHDPFMTGKDTVRLNKVMDIVYNLPEVQAIDKRINDWSKATHGISMSVQDNFGGDTSYHNILVGNKSKAERRETI
jgi:hypothetical protein